MVILARWMLLAAAEPTTHNLSIFDPASPGTRSIFNLAILSFAVVGLIFIIVEGVLLYSVWRFREKKGERTRTEPAQVYGSDPIEIAWTAAPAMIVFFLLLVTTRTLWEVKAAPPEPKPDDDALYVTVVGRQWWWEYRYETYNGKKLGFITANELHVPLSEPGKPRSVHLRLESADVCHSFWVPRLAGKTDLIPGRTNTLSFEAKEPGLFVGQCAEYCGEQHANMLLRVIVDTPADFEKWLSNEELPALEVASVAEGKRTFLAHSCVNCHRVRGTPAVGTYAPDLTHLMARETLASGMIPNTPENLLAWVRDPQAIKVGCLMPAFGLSTKEDELITEYLRTLK